MKQFLHKPDETVLAERLAADRQKFEALPGDAPGRKAAYYDDASRLEVSFRPHRYKFAQVSKRLGQQKPA